MKLVEISQDLKLSLILKTWQSKYSESLVTIKNKKARRNTTKFELYQLLGFYESSKGWC